VSSCTYVPLSYIHGGLLTRFKFECVEAEVAFFVLRAYGSPAIMAPYIFCFAHMGVPRSWHPIYFLPFCVARIWESRDHGTLYFCSAHAAEVDVKETRSGHVPYGVVLRSSINAFYTMWRVSKNQILEI
jgi:hypothetical protein